jgi:hypothetical protein
MVVMSIRWWPAAVALAIAAMACSDSTETETEAPLTLSDVPTTLERARASMNELDSYRQELSLSPEGEPITFLVDYAKPGNYYERLLEAPDVESTVELVLADGSIYVRQCSDYPDGCEDWEFSDATSGVPSLGGLTGVVPETLGLTAVGMIEDPTGAGTETVDGRELIRIRGSVNLPRAIYENQRPVFESATEFGETCETQIGTGATPTTVCREQTFEEAYEESYGNVDFDASPPSRVDVLVDGETLRIHQVVIGVPGNDEDTYLEVEYSDFNDVSIEVPSDAIASD